MESETLKFITSCVIIGILLWACGFFNNKEGK
jgi:hypothetical protein